MTSTPTPSVRLRRLVSATLFAAAVALGGGTLADPAIASAEREWDIGAYDKCIENVFLGGAGRGAPITTPRGSVGRDLSAATTGTAVAVPITASVLIFGG